ncbi:MAG: hypothetical protein CVV49_10400 [Spirochaetae bacterium HGW-Spirochaetae-5]|nr:MAG: hypothetical protein CVV49_10400 [Spirochaetae bacterium HGW-Spirochaetae-5]
MINDETSVEKLLVKFRFTEPVPVQYRDYISSSKRKNLTRLLKEKKNYGAAVWGALIIYMLLRKLGITVSFLQAAVISGLTAAAVAVTVSAGAVKAVSMVVDKKRIIEKSPVYEERATEVHRKFSGGKSAAVVKFSGTEGTGYLRDRATSVFADTLRNEIGESKVSYGDSADKKYIITGSVEKLPEGYILTSRIIDKSTSVIIHMEMKEVNSEENLYRESRKMALKLAGKLK